MFSLSPIISVRLGSKLTLGRINILALGESASMEESLLGFNAVKHRTSGFPDRDGVLSQGVAQRRADGPCAREEPAAGRVRAVLVRREEDAARVAREVLERLRQLRVVDVHVQPADYRRDVRIQSEFVQGERLEGAIGWILGGGAAISFSDGLGHRKAVC